MEFNIVTSLRINNEIKKSKYYQVSLGHIITDMNNRGALNTQDNFASYYFKKNKHSIFGQGIIGDISFYTDHYIREDKMLIYFDKDEYKYDFDFALCNEKGISSYLGLIIKEIEDKRKEQTEKIINDLNEMPAKGDYMKVIKTPWAVTQEDILAYAEAKKNGLI